MRPKVTISALWSLRLGDKGSQGLTRWQDFHRQKAAITQLLPDGYELGVAYPSPQADTFCYFAGAQAAGAEVSAGLSFWQLPAGDYIACTFEAENFTQLVIDALYKAQAYLF